MRAASLDPLVSLRDVTVRYPARERAVLTAIDCEVARGENVVIFGASGSGKSSILQLISGVIPHSVTASLEGTVSVDGVDVAESSVVELSRTIGVVAQDPESQLCLARVEDEIALGLENRGTPPAEIDVAIDAALDLVGAGALRMRDTATLSGGECQRLGIAAALVARPRLLLLDEPTSMLDADGVTAVRSALGRAVQGIRPTIVLVEHRLDEIAGAAGPDGLPERAIVVGGDGRILAQGSTRTVLAEHARELHAGGCWLPLDTELLAITSCAGGLSSEANQRLLSEIVGRDRVIVPAEAGEVLLSATGLSIGHGDRELASELSLGLRAGTVTTLLGRNGAGKSTLLRTLAGLTRPLAGRVDGERAGMVFQNPEHQFTSRSVEAEIELGLRELGQTARREATEQILADYRLEHLRTQNPWRLSGGEKRRLSIAAMLAHRRRVILADEPSYGLDRRDALAAMGALRRAADDGCTVVVSSHDVRCIAAISDEILVLDGRESLRTVDAAAALRDDSRLAEAGVRVPPLVRHFAERAGSAQLLRAFLSDFERSAEESR